METLQAVFETALALFQMPLSIYGFTFSFWQVFVWSIVAGLIITFLAGVFNH